MVKHRDKSEQWRAASVYSYSQPLKGWILRGQVTIKPHESIKAKRLEQARELGLSSIAVKLKVWIR